MGKSPPEVTMSPNRHPGITMHKLSFGGGFIGLLFAAGSALIFLLGFPTLWYFVAGTFALGMIVALLLHFSARRSTDHNRPLSILSEPASAPLQSGRSEKKKVLHQIYPAVASA